MKIRRMHVHPACRAAPLALLLAAACGGSSPPPNPYVGSPPKGAAIAREEGTPVGATGWRWIDFPDTVCTTRLAGGGYGTVPTGLAIDWGSGPDVVVSLMGGGACWDFITCGGAGGTPTASTGPFGANEFAALLAAYPNAMFQRARLPPALASATVVFVPYCTGDVHGGDRVTTYTSPIPGLAPVTWHHVGHANLMAFLRRLGATFAIASPARLVVAGSSAGGFGALANYPAFRWYWPDAAGYLVDDSGPPLVGDAVPPASRSAWWADWNLGASLDAFCPDCRTDLSAGLRELSTRYPSDRIALLSHTRDATICAFYGAYDPMTLSFAPMSGATFEAELYRLATTVIDPTANARYFFTVGTAHPMLDDPGSITTPSPGLDAWLESMIGGGPDWTSAHPRRRRRRRRAAPGPVRRAAKSWPGIAAMRDSAGPHLTSR